MPQFIRRTETSSFMQLTVSRALDRFKFTVYRHDDPIEILDHTPEPIIFMFLRHGVEERTQHAGMRERAEGGMGTFNIPPRLIKQVDSRQFYSKLHGWRNHLKQKLF